MTTFTKREDEVMVLLGQAKTAKEIAKVLGTSYKTVEVQIATLREKTGARNKTALALLAHGIKV